MSPVSINVRVIPNSKRCAVERNENGIKIWLTAPPVEGKANKALIQYMAKEFDLRKKEIIISSGERSRTKVITIERSPLPEKLQQLLYNN